MTPRKDDANGTPADVAELYRLPLSEFVAARDRLARDRRQAGDRDGATAVKALVRPSVAAWTVNQLWWQRRPAFDRLLAAGEAVRQAVRSGRRESQDAAGRERRDALGSLVEEARELLAEAGQVPSADTLERVRTTLDALAAWAGEHPEGRAGTLARDLAAPGFGAFEGLGPIAVPPPVPPRALATPSRVVRTAALQPEPWPEAGTGPEPQRPDFRDNAAAARERAAEERRRETLARVKAAVVTAREGATAAHRRHETAATAATSAAETVERLVEELAAARTVANRAEREAISAARAAEAADVALRRAEAEAERHAADKA